MIGFAESLLTWLATTLLPAFAGLLVITWASKKIPAKYIAAFAFGILFWFFVDTISGSAVLGVNSGFGGGLSQAGLVVLFPICGIFFFWIHFNREVLSPQTAMGKLAMTIPELGAFARGNQCLGRGA